MLGGRIDIDDSSAHVLCANMYVSVVVAPTSLVSNWKQEIAKWLGPRLTLIALSETTREQVLRCRHASVRAISLRTFHFAS